MGEIQSLRGPAANYQKKQAARKPPADAPAHGFCLQNPCLESPITFSTVHLREQSKNFSQITSSANREAGTPGLFFVRTSPRYICPDIFPGKRLKNRRKFATIFLNTITQRSVN